jgi:cytochrome c biogenesis protein CcdA
LSAFELLKSLPWLILYNIIFVLPMIGITLFVYWGYTSVEKVTGWKEEHIKYLHLVAGLVLAALGIAMLLGYI